MSNSELNYRDILQEIERFGGLPSDKPFFIKPIESYQTEAASQPQAGETFA